MVGGTGFELVTPTMSILEIANWRRTALCDFNDLQILEVEHCCSLVVGLGFSWHLK